VSVVHTLVSAQSLAAPARHEPPEQVSASVQPLPSSHEAVLCVCVQLPAPQASSVHGFASLQSPTSRHSAQALPTQ